MDSGEMKALIIRGKQDAIIDTVAIPKVKPNEVLIEVKACGICKTDIEIFRGTVDLAKYPVIPGHEFSGIVVDVGHDVTSVSKGDRVTVDPNIPCGKCYYCRTARKHFCENWNAIGVTLNGAYAQYVKVPEHVVYNIPNNMPFDAACLTEPVACVLHGLYRISPSSGSYIAIFGAGPIGLMFLQLLKEVASRIIVFEINPYRSKVAEKLGADYVINPLKTNVEDEVSKLTNRRGVDIAIVATGNVKAIETAIKILAPTGKLLLFGVAHKDAVINVRPFEVYRKELTIMGSFTNPYTMNEAIDLLMKGVVNYKELITHRVQLEDALNILAKGLPKKGIKVIITKFA